VRLVLDADGEVLDRIRYAPYGEVVEGTGPSLDRPYGFTGEWTDPVTGFVFLRARHYDPSTGRFLSRDQAPPDLQRPVTLNTYLYAGGAPTHLVDPYGTFSLAGMMTSVAIVGRLYAILSNPVLDVFTQLASSLVAYTLGRAALDRSGLFQFIRADPTRLIPRGLLWGVSGAVNFVGAGLVGGTDAILTLWGPYAGTLASYVYGGYTIGGSSVPKVDSWSLYNGIVWDVVTPASYEGHAYSLSAAAPLLLVGMLGWMGDLLLDAFVQGRWNFWGRMATLGVPAVAVAALSLASKDLLARMAQITQMSFAWSSSAGDTTLPPGAGGGAVKTQTWAIAWELAGPNALPRAGGGKFTLYGFSGTWAHCVGTTALFGGPPPPLPGTCMLGP